MQSVSSGAVASALAQALDNRHFKLITDTFTINSGYISLDPQMANANYYAFVQRSYAGSAGMNLIFTVQQYQSNILYIYVRDGNGSMPANGTQVKLNILIMY